MQKCAALIFAFFILVVISGCGGSGGASNSLTVQSTTKENITESEVIDSKTFFVTSINGIIEFALDENALKTASWNQNPSKAADPITRDVFGNWAVTEGGILNL